MGYCIDCIGYDFKIKKENAPSVVKTLKDFAETHHSDCGHIMWVDNNVLIESDNIETSMEEIRYPVAKDNNGDYVVDYFEGEKLGEEQEIFEAIAPYVVENSYVEFEGEDGDVFKFIFKDGKCKYEFVGHQLDNDD